MRSDRDAKRGLYGKYVVTRSDGSSGPGEKHEHCRYFVLDLTHDQFARPALEAYARACWGDFPKLGADLMAVVNGNKQVARKIDRKRPVPRPLTQKREGGGE